MVANGAGVRGVAGLNATVWIEDRAGEVCIDDFDGAGEVWVDAQVCAICTCDGGRIATKLHPIDLLKILAQTTTVTSMKFVCCHKLIFLHLAALIIRCTCIYLKLSHPLPCRCFE